MKLSTLAIAAAFGAALSFIVPAAEAMPRQIQKPVEATQTSDVVKVHRRARRHTHRRIRRSYYHCHSWGCHNARHHHSRRYYGTRYYRGRPFRGRSGFTIHLGR